MQNPRYIRLSAKVFLIQDSLLAGLFLMCFRDPMELKIGSLEPEKIVIGSLESEKTGSLESEKSGPYRLIRGT